MNVMDLWFFIRIRETLDKNDLKILNRVFSLLVFLSVDKNYTDNNNLVVLHMKKKKNLKHKDMYVYLYVMVWVFLELQINMVVLPRPLQTKIYGYVYVLANALLIYSVFSLFHTCTVYR